MLKKPLNRFNTIERDFYARQFSEIVFKYGFEAVYVQKTDFDKNITLGEFDKSIFDKAYEITCIVRGIREFSNQSFGTKFGFEEIDQSSLFIDDNQIKELGLVLKENDIIVFPQLNNKIFEINFITNETDMVKYHFGVGYSWQMDVEKYAVDLSDRFMSGNDNVDNINNISQNSHKNNKEYEIKQDQNQIYSTGNNPLLDND